MKAATSGLHEQGQAGPVNREAVGPVGFEHAGVNALHLFAQQVIELDGHILGLLHGQGKGRRRVEGVGVVLREQEPARHLPFVLCRDPRSAFVRQLGLQGVIPVHIPLRRLFHPGCLFPGKAVAGVLQRVRAHARREGVRARLRTAGDVLLHLPVEHFAGPEDPRDGALYMAEAIRPADAFPDLHPLFRIPVVGDRQLEVEAPAGFAEDQVEIPILIHIYENRLWRLFLQGIDSQQITTVLQAGESDTVHALFDLRHLRCDVWILGHHHHQGCGRRYLELHR